MKKDRYPVCFTRRRDIFMSGKRTKDSEGEKAFFTQLRVGFNDVII